MLSLIIKYYYYRIYLEWLYKLIILFLIGPPGNDGIGLPGRQGDRGEPGRPGKRILFLRHISGKEKGNALSYKMEGQFPLKSQNI